MIDVSRRGLLGMLAAGVGAAIVAPGIIMPIKPKLVVPQFVSGQATVRFGGPARFTITGYDMAGNLITESGAVSSVGGVTSSELFCEISSVIIDNYSYESSAKVDFPGPLGVVTNKFGPGYSAIEGMSPEQVRLMSLTGILSNGLNVKDMSYGTDPRPARAEAAD